MTCRRCITPGTPSRPTRSTKTAFGATGWIARVTKSEDDEGWTVEMIKVGEPESALVRPETMGATRDPELLNTAELNTLVTTAA